ncbi:MAG: hypothetical protein AVDCRST_MAG41-215 [uncultured Corynebacteriales bacterium]|uniref:Putative T7SS secretion signal domain-containing protein n=1 Tax=uncultured Mycobacteriales bacterium TaxID=581187 RepID=A0A6J4H8Y9_9ACTN|nr:MAG: hypothetical protein AVDCRST_MAG41-215 [uncultured Corynebacteriales bacterium]
MTVVTPGSRPADLVPGEPDEVDRLAARLTRIAVTAGDAGSRLATLDAEVWTGESAQVFQGAIGDVPARLSQAAGAFGSAAQALTAYARALREGQATAAGAIRMVEQATPETLAAEQGRAAALVTRASAEVDAAGRLAAERLARAEADAPVGEAAVPDRMAGCEMVLRVGTEHELADPGGYVSPPGDWGGSVAEMRYTTPHDVAFAAGLGGDTPPSWDSWAAGGQDRAVGVVEPAAVVTATGAAVAAGALIGRRSRRGTALGLAGLTEAELRRRRAEFGGARHRESGSGHVGVIRLHDTSGWRTRLVSGTRTPSTVPPWTGSGADPLPRVRLFADRSGSVDRDVRGAVLRTGRPAHEGS